MKLETHCLSRRPSAQHRAESSHQPLRRRELISLRERLIKTGARLVRHGRYAIFQMAEAALPRQVFAGILALINGLRGPPFIAVYA